MTLLEFLVLLAVAGVCGGIGQSLAGGGPKGCLATVALGFVGALLGSWLAGALGLPEFFVISLGGSAFPIVWSILGSALFVALMTFFTSRRRRR